MAGDSFFSLSGARRPVNQWLCIAFISLLCFWTVLYYFTERATIAAEAIAAPYSQFTQHTGR